MKRIICFVFLTLLCCFLPMTLFADSDFMNLVVNCPRSNMQVSLYRVADENYNLVDSFSRYSIDLKQDVQGAANALENRILMDGIEADASGFSDSSCKASFTWFRIRYLFGGWKRSFSGWCILYATSILNFFKWGFECGFKI